MRRVLSSEELRTFYDWGGEAAVQRCECEAAVRRCRVQCSASGEVDVEEEVSSDEAEEVAHVAVDVEDDAFPVEVEKVVVDDLTMLSDEVSVDDNAAEVVEESSSDDSDVAASPCMEDVEDDDESGDLLLACECRSWFAGDAHDDDEGCVITDGPASFVDSTSNDAPELVSSSDDEPSVADEVCLHVDEYLTAVSAAEVSTFDLDAFALEYGPGAFLGRGGEAALAALYWQRQVVSTAVPEHCSQRRLADLRAFAHVGTTGGGLAGSSQRRGVIDRRRAQAVRRRRGRTASASGEGER